VRLIALLLLVMPGAADARRQGDPVIAIVGATVIDGTGREPAVETVLIRGGRIAAVGPNLEVPAGARVLSGEGHALLPGLFDLHTHLPYATAAGVVGDWPRNLKAYLYCGVTSVVDFGTYPETFEPMRRLVGTGVIDGPRLSLAARMTTPGGHGAEGGRGDFFSLEVSTPREARAAVRRVLPYRPDVIKVFTDGWRYGAAPDMSSMNEETLSALVDEAHRHGLEVLTHTVTLEKAKIAARAGVDVIAHGVGNAPADDELVELMRAKGMTYAPTLAVYEPRGRDILSPLLAAVLDPAARDAIQPPLVPPDGAPAQAAAPGGPRSARWRHLNDNTAALRRGGVRFGVGTDAGVTGTHHGWATLRELRLLVAGGLTPIEAITAATGNSARALKVADERGTIAPGKLADLVLVEGEPHRRIGDVEHVRRVFLGGQEIDRERLAREISSTAVTPLPARRVRELVDDFESRDGRSSVNSLWVNGTESGHDHSRAVFGRTPRAPGDHALSVMARMAERETPFARVSVPLSPGAVEPADASGFRGVIFDARGEGDYRLIVPTRGTRIAAYYQAPFTVGPRWQRVKVAFSALRRDDAKGPVPWTGTDLLMLTFEVSRPPGALGWLEIDNVRFY